MKRAKTASLKREPGFRVPEFRTDAEELAWLDQNRERLTDLTLKHGAKVTELTKQISIRLPVRDLERAKQIARERKVNYQSVIKSALRRGLRHE